VNGLTALIARDLRLALRQRGDALTAVLFFVLTTSIFPFGLGPEPNLLARIAPGIIWVTALLAVLLSLDRLFLIDHEDGSLEQLVLSPEPLEALVLAKVLAHWLTSGLPLIAATPVIGLLYNMPADGYWVLLGSMLLGTPTLSLIGAIGAALSLGARRGGVLVPLLVMPLYVPVLIFGVSAIDMALSGMSAKPHLLLLGGALAISLPVTAFAAAAALRQAVE
jgi:heme exporter protein B|tara:strand:+ start:4076 stop:4741 length:666 start_codon:yes stop_codon:yes gene_type:complete